MPHVSSPFQFKTLLLRRSISTVKPGPRRCQEEFLTEHFLAVFWRLMKSRRTQGPSCKPGDDPRIGAVVFQTPLTAVGGIEITNGKATGRCHPIRRTV
jgi:hypothetical protein